MRFLLLKKFPLVPSIIAGSVVLSGCETTAIRYDGQDDIRFEEKQLRSGAAPLTVQGPLSLAQVERRALQHNSEYAQAQTQLINAVNKAGKRGKDIMPTLFASSYGNWRNNVGAGTAINVESERDESSESFFTAQDQAVATSDFTASWDLLEVGLAGYKANRRTIQSFNQAEQNQYLCNKLVVDVNNAYWRAVAFEEAERKSKWLQSRVFYALDVSQKRAEENPNTKYIELLFQREIIDLNRWYQALFRSLVSAKPDLARLMNLPAGTEFELESKRLPAGLGEFAKKDITELVYTAYRSRPEIKQAQYRQDLTRIRNKETLWRHLPALRLFVSGNDTTNSFVLNSNFISAGANLSWDLMRLTQIGETKRQGQIALDADKQQAEIIASAIMAQVMIAKEQVKKLDFDLSLAWKGLSIQGQIADDIRAGVEKGEKQETMLIKEELLKELYFLREQMTRAELHTAKARLEQSIGQVSACQASISDTETPQTHIVKTAQVK